MSININIEQPVGFIPWMDGLTVAPIAGGHRVTASDSRYWDVRNGVVTADRGNVVDADTTLVKSLLWAVQSSGVAPKFPFWSGA